MRTFFLDIDGVIYKDNIINVNVINTILESKNNIVFCTGRGYLRCLETIKDFITKDLIIILENGAQIVINDKKIFSKSIDGEVKKFLNKIDVNYVEYIIFASLNSNSYYAYNNDSKELLHVRKYYNNFEEFMNKLELEEVGQITIKLNENCKKQFLDICLENNIEVKLSENYFIINPKGISKKSAVEFIIDNYNLKKEDIIIVGNDKNDLEMFEINCQKIAVIDKYTPQELINKATFCTDFKSLESIIRKII